MGGSRPSFVSLLLGRDASIPAVLRVIIRGTSQVFFQISRPFTFTPTASTNFVDETTADVMDLTFLDSTTPNWGNGQPTVPGDWNVGDAWRVLAPGVPDQIRPGNGVIEEFLIVEVRAAGSGFIQVTFDAPITSGGIPNDYLADDTNTAVTLAESTVIDSFTVIFLVTPGTFESGDSWSVNSPIGGEDAGQTGVVI